ncbi:bifunctional P-450:NADPH-P450 reductase [Polyplosphaeria fusca]|uniref:Bifunctional cytochrome P450/NADPH--P450 reductase n=1 Tax=Polyplosphaeria fusca TaxID=682080 RepID=A0A9P4R4A1_9PLEO|nr:bifunctional P-450:NADPH-P450 reductase [Polyplosphaeria fusca]
MAKTIPSPPGLPIIGNLLDVSTGGETPLTPLERLADEYGPIYKITVSGTERVVISNHEMFKEVCDETRFFKAAGPGLRALSDLGMFLAQSEKSPDWGQAHRVLVPAFGPLSIRNMFDEMHDIASQLVLKWARRGPSYKIPVTDDFTRLTLDTIALCTMNFRFNSFYQDEMHPFVDAMLAVLSEGGARQKIPKVVQRFMRNRNELVKRNFKLMKDTSEEIVRHRRQNPTDKKDLLDAMINNKDPKTGESMRDELIAANLTTFLVAGHETTSGLLSFAFHNMLKNPSTYFKAVEEVDKVVGKGRITVDHLKNLNYISAILRETLRLHPTAPLISRGPRDENTESPPTVGGFALQKEWPILCLIAKIQRDPKVYGDDANEFRPERMLDEEFDKLPPGAWKPFGTGIRACIGRPLAWQEALLVVAMLLQNFDFRLDDESYKLKIKANLTIKPDDLYVRATLRQGVSATTLQLNLSAPAGGLKETELQRAPTLASRHSDGKPMTILFGSNSGTCQAFAQKLAGDARRYGFHATTHDLDVGMNALPRNQPVIIVTSSYEGEPPDNARQFVAWLDSIESQSLTGVHYAVFGCGHKDWSSTFQRIPKLINGKLEHLGGTRISELGISDASQNSMFEDFDAWVDYKLWPAVHSTFGRVEVSESQKGPQIDMDISTKTRASHLQHDVQQGKVLMAKRLTATGEPEKRHLVLKLPEGLEYEAGDYLAVLPVNPDEVVHRVLNRFSLPWDAVITIRAGGPVTFPENTPTSVSDLLKGFVELSQPATKKNIQVLTEHTSDSSTLEQLDLLASTVYQTEVVSKRISVLDLLELHSQIALPFAEFLTLLPPMRPRHYSISSSPLRDPGTCSITYGVINDESLAGTGRFQGVAGTYLSSLRSGDAISVSIRTAPATFHMPASPSQTPIVMFCNGTGLAPFRAFVQERATQIAANPQQKLAPALLFIGCRSAAKDSLYREEIGQWVAQGAVDVRYAYSSEPDHPGSAGCKYVQDRMTKDRKDIIDLWKQGAKVYLCGSPGLVEGIKTVARGWVEAKEGTDPEKIQKFFESMRNERIAVDVFA